MVLVSDDFSKFSSGKKVVLLAGYAYSCDLIDGLQSDQVELKLLSAKLNALGRPASIGPGGIEIWVRLTKDQQLARLQSDQVELK